MGHNVLVKSLLRNKRQSVLLFLLIGLSAFGFVLRGVEFAVVREQIHAIAHTYQSVVTFHPHDDPMGDVSQVVSVLEGSEQVRFFDHRPIARAYLTDINNSDVIGPLPWTIDTGRASTEVLFYARLIAVFHVDPDDEATFAPPNWHVHQGFLYQFMVDHVYMGFEEHVRAGEYAILRMPPSDENLAIFEAMTALGYGEASQQLLIRGVREGMTDSWSEPVWERGGGQRHIPEILMLSAINQGVYPYDQALVYWLPVPVGQNAIDMSADPVTAHLPALIDTVRDSQRQLILHGVTDSDLNPFMQAASPVLRLADGRMLTHADSLDNNPVAVINSRLAVMRGLSVGDYLYIRVPNRQYYTGVFTTSLFMGGGGADLGQWQEPMVATATDNAEFDYMALEIVGVYAFRMGGMFGRDVLSVYVPSSLLEGIAFTGARHVADWEEGHLPATLLSAVLTDSRYEQAFLFAYQDLFADMGITLNVRSANSSFFWEIATGLLTTLGFNLGLFSVLFVFVGVLVMFLYLRTQVGNLAIMRSVGTGKGSVYAQLGTSLCLLVLPAMLIGGLSAYIAGQEMTAGMLDALAEFGQGEWQASVAVSWSLVGAFVLAGFAVLMLLGLGGAVLIINQPVLELLQSRRVVLMRRKKPRVLKARSLNLRNTTANHVANRILRQGAKSGLGFLLGLLVVISMGWVQESILRTRRQIDDIYTYTQVSAAVLHDYGLAGFGSIGFALNSPGFVVGGPIMGSAIREIRALSFVQDFYAEGGNVRAFALHPTAQGGLPTDWARQIGYDVDTALWHMGNHMALDGIYGLTDLEHFVAVNTPDMYGLLNIHIDIMDGFDMASFNTPEGFVDGYMPVIVSESTQAREGFAMGQRIVIGYGQFSMMINQYRYGVVVGVHNQVLYHGNMPSAILVPLSELEAMLTPIGVSYTVVQFGIDPAYNRNMIDVREHLQPLVARSGMMGDLYLLLTDEYMRNHVSAVTQTLLLLEMLSPVTQVFSRLLLLGVVLLLTLQSAKQAAVMRILGHGVRGTQWQLVLESLLVYSAGIVAGVAVVSALDWGFGMASLVVMAGFYALTVIIAAVLGAFTITKKSPLALLQTRD